jgi:Ca2+-binding EF-hand superfamily protein
MIVPEQSERKSGYRPSASIQRVHDTIARSLGEIVSISALQADMFVSLFELYDKDETLAVRYGHLVDAAECLEIALTHLGQLKSAVAYRLRTEDEQNEPLPF